MYPIPRIYWTNLDEPPHRPKKSPIIFSHSLTSLLFLPSIWGFLPSFSIRVSEMANRTDPLAKSIRGTNPQNLVEKIVRSKIYQNTYWKEQCFGLTAETLVDKAMELDHLGGTFGGNRKPAPFICLVMKMLQIQPEKDIVVEFIKNEDYKYVRVLGAFYLRLTGTDVDIYRYLEPLYNDYRKLRRKLADGRKFLLVIFGFR